jgi:serine/threonine protein kinase
MPDERWARLKTLFHQALEVPADRRAAFVSDACADDDPLRLQLDAMLASVDTSATFLETPAADLLSRSAPLEKTIVDGKYRLDARLGEGGMGVVYRATHLALRRPCAIKLIRATETANPAFLRQFELEAATLGQLRHRGVVSVTDYGVDMRNGAVPYLVMEYLEGKTLADHCAARGPLPISEALPVLQAIAEAIDHAHQQGILHRDLKPANVFLGRDGSGAEGVKIVDFGLARFTEAARDHAFAAMHDPATAGDHETVAYFPGGAPATVFRAGTPAYMAPEITRGEDPSASSDIYAFGVLAFEILVGRTPFQGSALEVLRAHGESQPPLPSEILPGLASALDGPLLAPLAKDPDARPRRAVEAVRELRRAAHVVELHRWRSRERPRRLLASAAIGFLVLVSPVVSSAPPLARLENKLVDLRARWSVARHPDPRILLLSIDEASLAADPTPLTARADEFGRTLSDLFRSGASGLAVDLLLPYSWSKSPAFSRFVLENADRLTLAALSSPTGTVVGPESIAGLTAAALGPDRASNLFAFVNRDADPDGVTRHGRMRFTDRSGSERDTLAARASRVLIPIDSRHAARSSVGNERFWIDPSIDSTRFERLSWKDVGTTIARTPAVFSGKLLLLGGEYLGSGDERHPIVHRAAAPDAVTGLVLQALQINTIADGFPVRERGRIAFAVAVATAAGVVAWVVLWFYRVWLGLFLFIACMAAALAASFLLFRQARVLVPTAAPMLFACLALAAALLVRRWLAPAPAGLLEES